MRRQYRRKEVEREDYLRCQRRWNRVRRELKRARIVCVYRDGNARKQRVNAMWADGQETEDMRPWEEALRTHGLLKYQNEDRRSENIACLKHFWELQRRPPWTLKAIRRHLRQTATIG